ncbi:hypothetical protein HYS93_01350 [Candidatus Daviesbacteria bacterium]|nr:hypothetical protein [Candidatus Daviesbacteria bacterium]
MSRKEKEVKSPSGKGLYICQSHLIDLFEALKSEDTSHVKQIEHQLTSTEKCVACSYLLKEKGPAGQILKSYLINQGYALKKTNSEKVDFFLKVLLALLIFIATLLSVFVFKSFFVPMRNYIGLFDPFGLVITLIISFMLFAMIDEKILS